MIVKVMRRRRRWRREVKLIGEMRARKVVVVVVINREIWEISRGGASYAIYKNKS